MPDLDFNFYAGGIEDGILEVLNTPMLAIGVKSFATYSGQLDSPEDLKRAIAAQTLQYPFVMVSYAGGESVRDPKTAAVLGRSLYYRHDCSFGVIVADNNPLGEKARRRSKVYQMISVVWNELTGIRLKKEVEVEGVAQMILLNTVPMEPLENVPIAKMPNITAYGVIIETGFKWSSPDRTVPGTPVTELVVGADKNETGILPPDSPGVKSEVEN